MNVPNTVSKGHNENLLKCSGLSKQGASEAAAGQQLSSSRDKASSRFGGEDPDFPNGTGRQVSVGKGRPHDKVVLTRVPGEKPAKPGNDREPRPKPAPRPGGSGKGRPAPDDAFENGAPGRQSQ